MHINKASFLSSAVDITENSLNGKLPRKGTLT